MRTHSFRSIPVKRSLGLLVLCLLLAANAHAGTSGTLKLKVKACIGTPWLSGADVDVVINRPGEGEVDSASGTTNDSGYVEFTFDDLEGGDEALVTVTPSGQDPDDNHTYWWIPPSYRMLGQWDLGVFGDSICQDSYYDEENNIILLNYQEE